MNDQPEARDIVEERAKMFEDMAAQIRMNKGAKFGGAFLIVPPIDAEVFSSLMLNQEEAAIFWASLKTLAEMGVQAAERANRQQGFGR
jgi:hypothetical protein